MQRLLNNTVLNKTRTITSSEIFMQVKKNIAINCQRHCNSVPSVPLCMSGERQITSTAKLLCTSGNQNWTMQEKQIHGYSRERLKWGQSDKTFQRTLCVAGSMLVGGLCLLGYSLLADEPKDGTKLSEDLLKALEKAANSNSRQNDGVSELNGKLSLQKAIEISRDLVQRVKDETGSPGLTVAVSVDGETVWAEGLGYADVENRVPCKPETVLRIASISKSITMAAVAKLHESGDLDLDKPVQHYVPDFPEKTWKGEKVTITTRQLLSHLAGIRHYDRDYIKGSNLKENEKDKTTSKTAADKSVQSKWKKKSGDSENSQSKVSQSESSQSEATEKKKEMELDEYYIKEYFKSVSDSLSLFKDDPLVNKPGSEFFYTTHGWTLISAVVEKAAKMPFEKYLQNMLQDLGMEHTYLEEFPPLIYNRGRHYVKNEKGRLVNAPYTDLSYKWAGGGLISDVYDLVKFGNAMLYSYQATGCHDNSKSSCLPGFLKQETMKMMWTKVDNTKLQWGMIPDGGYGLGWGVWDSSQQFGKCREQPFIVSHTGAAIGGSSVLLILPSPTGEQPSSSYDTTSTAASESSGVQGRSHTGVQGRLPKGVVVSIIVNMLSVSLQRTAFDVARVFDKVDR